MRITVRLGSNNSIDIYDRYSGSDVFLGEFPKHEDIYFYIFGCLISCLFVTKNMKFVI